MIRLKTKEQIDLMREGGKRLAFILNEVGKAVKPGVSTEDLNILADKLARENGDKPSTLNYKPKGSKEGYPASICISLNDAICHGVPNINPKILKDGDIISLDMLLTHKGFITDSAFTIPVGNTTDEQKKLIDTTKKALEAGIKVAKIGNTLGDIGYEIERVAKANGFSVVDGLCGHGVGFEVHEEPFVQNIGERGQGLKLKEGMVIAIEPMFAIGKKEIELDDDGYTYKTADGSLSAHFEHTVAITKKGPEVLTRL